MDPIDLARLRDFSDGTDSGVRELARFFLQHMDECLSAVRAAVAAGDWGTVRKEAHRGGGTAGACGAGELSSMLLRLEVFALERRTEEAAVLIPGVERELALVSRFLDSTFPGAGGQDQVGARI